MAVIGSSMTILGSAGFRIRNAIAWALENPPQRSQVVRRSTRWGEARVSARTFVPSDKSKIVSFAGLKLIMPAHGMINSLGGIPR